MKLRKSLIVLVMTALAAGCGDVGSTTSDEQHYPAGYYFNPSSAPIILAKSTALAAGNEVNSGEVLRPQTPSIKVAGCLPGGGGGIKVCYEDVTLMPAAAGLAADLGTIILPAVVATIGEPGPVDILVAQPGNTGYSGAYINAGTGRRTAIVTPFKDSAAWLITFAVHELGHAAFDYAGGDTSQPWINEALATFAELQLINLYPAEVLRQTAAWHNTPLNSTPGDGVDYARAQTIGRALAARSGLPIGPKLAGVRGGDEMIKALTGLSLTAFAEVFWRENLSFVSKNQDILPQFGAAYLPAGTYPAGLINLIERTSQNDTNRR